MPQSLMTCKDVKWNTWEEAYKHLISRINENCSAQPLGGQGAMWRLC